MQCPKCQSQDVSLCSVAHEQGTTTTHTSGSADFGGSAMHGGVALKQNINTTSESQTAFAERCAPPTSSLGTALGFCIALMALLFIAPQFGTGQTVMRIMQGLFGLCAVWSVLAFLNLPKHRAALARWRKTWICGRCGTFFVPEE